jgi:xanthine dehydrogenase accessory factor
MMNMAVKMAGTFLNQKVHIRGGGEMASGIAHRLHQSRFRVLITEVEAPTAVRRTVAFAEAAYQGFQTIEGVKAVRVADADEMRAQWQDGNIPLLIDSDARIRRTVSPDVVVDAIMAKKNSDTNIADAPLVIGIGPGFTAGVNAHAVVESNRGYNLGRVIWSGSAEPDTGVPAPVAGHTEARVLRASRSGRFKGLREIGDVVQRGEIVGEIDGEPLQAEIAGLVRGMLKSGVVIRSGVKVGDIDPRGEREYCYSISDKARAIGGGVLEAILHSLERLKHADR